MSLGIIDITTSGILSALVKAFLNGSRKFRIFFIINSFLFVSGLTIKLLADYDVIYYELGVLGVFLLGISALIFLGIYAYQITLEENEVKKEILTVKDRIKEHPNEPTAAWELARIKLENYLNRNLTQIKWIFVWTVLIMIAGFVIIGYGIVNSYQPNSSLDTGILTTSCGLIIEIIGATFLLIYKSTMSQAKEYVNVLERINAVGMSVQILDSIAKDKSSLQDNTRAEIAKQLLEMYSKN